MKCVSFTYKSKPPTHRQEYGTHSLHRTEEGSLVPGHLHPLACSTPRSAVQRESLSARVVWGHLPCLDNPSSLMSARISPEESHPYPSIGAAPQCPPCLTAPHAPLLFQHRRPTQPQDSAPTGHSQDTSTFGKALE